MTISNKNQVQNYIIYLGCFITCLSLALQIYISLTLKETAPLFSLLKLSTFFTVVSNTLLTIYFLVIAISKDRLKWRSRIGIATALVSYMTLVAIVFQVLLSAVWKPTGLQWWVGQFFHVLNPAFFIFYWGFFVPKKDIQWRQVPIWLSVPTIYYAYVLLLGSFSVGYPYPFLNVEKLGIAQVLLNGIGLLITISMIALFYVGLAKLSRVFTKNNEVV